MNELFRALQGMAQPASDPDRLDLDWRGKSVRLLTPDEVEAFARWAHGEVDRLRQERDEYLGRAITAEAELSPERRSDPNYDTREEREMDLPRRRCWED